MHPGAGARFIPCPLSLPPGGIPHGALLCLLTNPNSFRSVWGDGWDPELGSLGSGPAVSGTAAWVSYHIASLIGWHTPAILALEEEAGSSQVPSLCEPRSETLPQKSRGLLALICVCSAARLVPAFRVVGESDTRMHVHGKHIQFCSCRL